MEIVCTALEHVEIVCTALEHVEIMWTALEHVEITRTICLNIKPLYFAAHSIFIYIIWFLLQTRLVLFKADTVILNII